MMSTYMKRCLVLLLVCVLTLGCLTACNTGPGETASSGPSGAWMDNASDRYIKSIFNVDVEKDIPYKEVNNSAGQNEKLLLDIYMPVEDTKERRAAIIWVHGGGLMFGNKQTGIERILAEEFAKKGYVTININYRLRENTNEDWSVTLKNAMDDVADAVDWAIANSEKYKIDTDHIAIGGHSAGGSLAINLCYKEDVEKENWQKKSVFCVVDMAGGDSVMGEFHKTDPPCIIINGTNDNLVPYFQSESFANSLDENGIDHILYAVNGAPHDLNDYSDEVTDVITKYMYKFLTGKDADMQIRSSPIVISYEHEYKARQINLQVDGKLDEWGNSDIIDLNQLKEAGSEMPSKEDFEGAAMVGWNQNDPNRVYIAAIITDDILQDIHPANVLFYEDDSLEVYFDLSSQNNNILIPLMPFIMGANGKDLSCFSTKENTDWAIVKNGNQYYYEAATDITKTGKGAPEPARNFAAKAGEFIGLSIAYNDCENGIRETQAGWIAGPIQFRKTFGKLLFDSQSALPN